MRNLPFILFLLLIGAVGFVYGCSESNSPFGKLPCADASDCAMDEVCKDHFCVPISDNENVCKNDADCAEGLSCIKGVCKYSIHPDADMDMADSMEELDEVEQTGDSERQEEESSEEPQTISCDDGNKCTLDVFEDTTCRHYPANEGEPCNDFDAHTKDDKCVNGKCVGIMEESNTCCGDDCTDCTKMLTRHGSYKCVNSKCSLWCDYGYLPVAGVCKSFQCNDDNPCTYDGYTEDGHTCIYAPVEDGTTCHEVYGVCSYAGTCNSGQCVELSISNCDDGIECTQDLCDPESGCSHRPDDTLCPEGYFCSIQDGGCVEDAEQGK